MNPRRLQSATSLSITSSGTGALPREGEVTNEKGPARAGPFPCRALRALRQLDLQVDRRSERHADRQDLDVDRLAGREAVGAEVPAERIRQRLVRHAADLHVREASAGGRRVLL